MTASVIHHSVS